MQEFSTLPCDHDWCTECLIDHFDYKKKKWKEISRKNGNEGVDYEHLCPSCQQVIPQDCIDKIIKNYEEQKRREADKKLREKGLAYYLYKKVSDPMKEKYYEKREDIRKRFFMKPCPSCWEPQERPRAPRTNVLCTECGHEWCYQCGGSHVGSMCYVSRKPLIVPIGLLLGLILSLYHIMTQLQETFVEHYMVYGLSRFGSLIAYTTKFVCNLILIPPYFLLPSHIYGVIHSIASSMWHWVLVWFLGGIFFIIKFLIWKMIEIPGWILTGLIYYVVYGIYVAIYYFAWGVFMGLYYIGWGMLIIISKICDGVLRLMVK
eukprot:TRINITY_DN473_c0_g1_i1.p1 TRINITY_DN473_c0_g1~~TRINITY_DN473_c0_g1_i1.p1  ORF type:complete len:363 (-),score=36.37 TRINITY_DN473_c0_g1_i1:32-985(-)